MDKEELEVVQNKVLENTDGYWDVDDGNTICLDGHFTIQELLCIIMIKENKRG